MQPINWADDLWDQFDNLLHYIDRGAGFCETLEGFFRERVCIELEYANKMRRLTKSMTNRRRTCQDLYQTLSFTEAFSQIVKEHDDIASQHELIAEHIRERVVEDIQTLARLVREQRRRSYEDNLRNKKALCKVADIMHKALRRYEDSYELSRKACENYQKANEDINLSRAQVEKARLQMIDKNTNCDQSKEEYIESVEKFNEAKHEFYNVSSPQMFLELQHFEETRINRVKSCLDTYIQCHEEVQPRITRCLEEMLKASSSISFASDAHQVVEFFHSGYRQPPDEIPIDFQMSDGSSSRLSYDNQSSLEIPSSSDVPTTTSLVGTLRRSRFGTLLKVKDMLKGRKNSLFGCDSGSSDNCHLSKLPPAQRLRRHKHMLVHLERQLKTKDLERQALLRMQKVFIDNPNLGEEVAVDEKLKATESDISDLTSRVKNHQILINELSENLNKISKSAIEHCSLNNNGMVEELPNGSHSCCVDEICQKDLTTVEEYPIAHSTVIAELTDSQITQQFPRDSLEDNCLDDSLPDKIEQNLILNGTTREQSSLSKEEKILNDSYSLQVVDVSHCVDKNYLGLAMANYDFSSEGFGDGIISISAGEELRIVEADTGDGWTKVENKHNQIGFVPTSYCLMQFSNDNT